MIWFSVDHWSFNAKYVCVCMLSSHNAAKLPHNMKWILNIAHIYKYLDVDWMWIKVIIYERMREKEREREFHAQPPNMVMIRNVTTKNTIPAAHVDFGVERWTNIMLFAWLECSTLPWQHLTRCVFTQSVFVHIWRVLLNIHCSSVVCVCLNVRKYWVKCVLWTLSSAVFFLFFFTSLLRVSA